MKHWIATVIALLALNGCMRDPTNLRDQTRSYMPINDVVPALDQCISKNGKMVRCDLAK